jgi:hypothetical protein
MSHFHSFNFKLWYYSVQLCYKVNPRAERRDPLPPHPTNSPPFGFIFPYQTCMSFFVSFFVPPPHPAPPKRSSHLFSALLMAPFSTLLYSRNTKAEEREPWHLPPSRYHLFTPPPLCSPDRCFPPHLTCSELANFKMCLPHNFAFVLEREP